MPKESSLPPDVLKSLKESKLGVSFEISTKSRQSSVDHVLFRKKYCSDVNVGQKGNENFEEANLDPFPYWGIYGFKKHLAHGRGIVKYQKYKDLILTEEEKSGILTERIMACVLSYLDVNPVSKKLVFTKAHLSRKKLTNIDVLAYYHYLQHIDLSCNKLKNLDALNQMPYLIFLNASKNFLDKILDFRPPYYLTYVNLSYNKITELRDLKDFWALRTLDLSHNKIDRICGLKQLKYLETLNLSYNKIRRIENLSYMNIITLNLKRNHISEFDGPEMFGFFTNPKLTYVDLDHNELSSLKIFMNARSIQSISIENNAIENLFEVTYLQKLPLLVYLNLKNNPVTKFPNYKLNVLSVIKKLNFLDTKRVDAKSKVQAETFFNPDYHEKASIQNATIQILNQIQASPYVTLGALPCDYPCRSLLAIVGPPSSRASRLANTLVHSLMSDNTKKLPKARLVIIHTTQIRKFKDGYYSMDRKEFTDMARNGEFAILYEIFQHCYGLTYQELEKTYDEPDRVLVVRINIVGALLLRLKGYRPYMVLALPSTAEVHKQWIADNFRVKPLHSIHRDSALRLQLIKDKIEDEFMKPLDDDDNRLSISDIEQELDNICMQGPVGESTEASIDSQSEKEAQDAKIEAMDTIKEIEEQLMKKLYDFGVTESELGNMVNTETEKISMKSSMTDVEVPEETISKTENPQSKKKTIHFEPPKETIGDDGFIDQSSTEPKYNPDDFCYCPTPISQKHFDQIMKWRELYLKFHQENPGIFCETVYADFYEEAMRKLKKLIIKIDENKHFDSPYYTFHQDDPVYKKLIGEKIKMFQMEIDGAMKRNVPGKSKVEMCTGGTEDLEGQTDSKSIIKIEMK